MFFPPQIVGQAALNKFCPVGYEDKTGFHYGKPGDRNEGDGRGSVG
jgi:hypothetical protein